MAKDRSGVPAHIAIIMDGNGRWAEARGLGRLNGHVEGVTALNRTVKAASKYGVEYLTVYAFSTENWGRPSDEVSGLMDLMCTSIAAETPSLAGNGVRMTVIGDTDSLSEKVRKSIAESEKATQDNSGLKLIIAMNYSSRWEITRMAGRIAAKVADGTMNIEEINEKSISDNLSTYGIPDPDLVIRTGGEYRLSNFLLWQSAYSELYFSDILWPDFNEQAFVEALEEYKKRDRRYGLVRKKTVL